MHDLIDYTETIETRQPSYSMGRGIGLNCSSRHNETLLHSVCAGGGERGGIITGRWRLWLLLPSPCTADPRTGAGGRGALAEDAGSWGDRYNNTTEHVDKWVWPPPLHSLPVVAR